MAAVAVASSSALPPPASAPADDALKAATFRRLHPRLYLDRFLAEAVRPDGRAADEPRALSVNVGAYMTLLGSMKKT
jgi:exosome complex component RRP43